MAQGMIPGGGRVREVVVGDIMRRLVARTMAKQVAKVDKATVPFQCALTTKQDRTHPANHHGQG